MTEILTESFCERCGSRYTFESSAPRKSRVGRIKVFSKGVRNFVMTDESSFSEAMADARSEEELVATTHQLDAFHKTFNFCLDCRQYTCGSCWNHGEGRCLTCAPDPTLEAAAAAGGLVARAPAEPVAEAPATLPGDAIAAEPWPDSDLAAERPARAVEVPAPIEVEADAEAAAGALVDAHVEAEAVGQAEPDEAASAPAPASFRGLEPGQTLEEAIADWEARQLPEPLPVEAEVEPLPVEAEVEPEPAAASGPEAVPPAVDVVPQPTWTVAATPAELATQPAPTSPVPTSPVPWLTVAPDDGSAAPKSSATPTWPTTPTWPQAGPDHRAPATLAGRPLLPQGDASAVWAASAREVLSAGPASLTTAAAAPTAQPCVGCGLPLSANARFCRRCGTRQP